jgi:pimeloyl-ACP methyl ester carboxylesterase
MGQIDYIATSQLDIAYEVSGPADGTPVVLVHGWPDSPRCWDDVLPLLHAAGCRVVAPYLRGFSPTRFRDGDIMRSGQVGALGHDLAELLDALDLRDVVLAGHDWGARGAYVVAALFPDRLRGLVALSTGYGTNSPRYRFGYEIAHAFWYQWFVATERGRRAFAEDRDGISRYLWSEWSPSLRFTEDEFAAAARAWANDDWPRITVHAYLHRWGEAAGDPAFEATEARMLSAPPIEVPTVVLHGDEDRGNPASSSEAKEAHFTAGYRRAVLPGVGHLLPREAPRETADAVLELAALAPSARRALA